MNHKYRALLVIAVLLIALMACNLPTQLAQQPAIPAPNQTLTALFAVTQVEPASTTATPTLPPVITATSAPEEATATTAPVTNPPTDTPAATWTTAPTKTRVPSTATRPPAATVPVTRARAQVAAKYLSTPPTIDGDWGEWKNLTTEYPANNIVWGRENWSNADDLSASFHVGWDNNYLYLAVKVRDEKYVQNAKGQNIYLGDSVEMVWDRQLQTDYYYTKLSPDDFQLGLNPGRPDPSGTKEAYLWFPSNIAGARSGVKLASVKEEGVYRVEAAIPWSVLETTPQNGAHYGFAVCINDNDDSTQDLQQSMASNVAGYRLADPTTWGDIQLVK